LFSPDGQFYFFVGVVEDINDPLEMGRVRVRMFGYHDQDRAVLPIVDLPWAISSSSMESASTSGKGSSPVGCVTGTWCWGFFLDGAEKQQPIACGTFPGSLPSADGIKRVGTFTQPANRELIKNKNDGVLKASDGSPILDTAGNPIATVTPTVSGWTLGQTSAQYESGGKGPGVINNYNGSSKGDYGGASYGCYQFASYLPTKLENGKSRPDYKKSPLVSYIGDCRFASSFKGLTPATPEFDAAWQKVASDNSTDFQTDQHEYIKKNYYLPYLGALKRNGLDLSVFGPGVQDQIWSTSVQMGPGAVSIFLKPLEGKSALTDKDIVNLVSEYKYQMVDITFKSSSQNIRDGIRARYKSEQQALLKLCN
jgi:hypothetical protein